jgi:hypothetical protein
MLIVNVQILEHREIALNKSNPAASTKHEKYTEIGRA